ADDELGSLYAKRKEIYPRARIGDRLGWFQRWRWAAVWLTQILFYGLPWLTWNDRQAVLFDLAARKFYVFGLVLWPQDVIYLTALLIIAALSLFLFTAIGGRLWCGYACPQTVYTELFMWIERRIEGDRSRRMALDKAPWSTRKLALKGAKHAAWIAVALWTGFTFVGYFTPIHDLGRELLLLAAGGWSLFWVLFYGFATYGNAGWMREQVCKYMCPYARFQSAMFDKDTLIVTYDAGRGEPRAPAQRKSRGMDRRTEGLGDCIDCELCVQVCPTGIDIRNGLQYECIGCAACIDACNHVMDKAGLPRGLVRYTTTNALDQRLSSRQVLRRVLRPRVLVYSGILLAVIAALAAAVWLRVPLKVDVIRDRLALAREVSDERGSALVENVYRLNVANTTERRQRYSLQVSGLPQLAVGSETSFEIEPASMRSVPLRLQAPADAVAPGSHKVTIEVKAHDDAAIAVREHTTVLGLRR
ncbi:MAG: cytochrome c oxidase accessory protein CcoG, partial [Betaproteobacteria bacterium]